jgi:hypothetical protein
MIAIRSKASFCTIRRLTPRRQPNRSPASRVASISIEELAEDIAQRTLLQSLNVRPVLDADGEETAMFEVPAGGRRFERSNCWSSKSA